MNVLLTKKYDSEDEEDEDFVPSEDDEEIESTKKRGDPSERLKKKVAEIWNEMKQNPSSEDQKPSKTDDNEITMDHIRSLIQKVKQNQPKPQVIKFAGKTFDLGDDNEYKIVDKTENIEKIEKEVEKVAEKQAENLEITITMSQKNEYLKNLLKIIEAKNINSMTKSRYDWKEYATKTNQEKNFSENRKDGYLEKKRFLEKSKQEEKEYNKSKKKLKN